MGVVCVGVSVCNLTCSVTMLPFNSLLTHLSYTLLLNLFSPFLCVLCPLVVGDAEPCHAGGHPGHS